MPRKTPRSELERYVGSLTASLRIRTWKRPEEWLKWIGLILIIQTIQLGQYLAAAGVFAAVVVGQICLLTFRLGLRNISPLSEANREKSAVGWVRLHLRNRSLESKIGPEAAAILERCATSANETTASVDFTVLCTVPRAKIIEGGGLRTLQAFTPITDSVEALMKRALFRCFQSTLLDRRLDEQTLADLGEIEDNLLILQAEAKRLRDQFVPRQGMPELAFNTLESIKAREELDASSSSHLQS